MSSIYKNNQPVFLLIFLAVASTLPLYAQKKADSLKVELGEIEINDKKGNTGIERLRAIEGTEIYAGKKNEVIVLKDIDANLSINNSRQVFAKVPGITVWENDPAGIQLAISTRGLNPNRTSEFNTRQNGYDMSADALGYPESYYSPATDALEKIQIIRGAASLQYGTQFGGVVNFILKQGPKDKVFEFNNKNTVGSYGLFSTFNSVGGTYKKLNYYGYYQYKTGNGWRPNTHFDVHTGYAAATYKVNDKLSITGNITLMQYLMQQPGGLVDSVFNANPSQSYRSRNWFSVAWNLAAISIDYKFNERNSLNIRNFGFLGSRKALGNLDYAFKDDDTLTNRNLIWDNYLSFGSEGRFLSKYNFLDRISSLLIGYRFYTSHTEKMQGNGNNKKTADFYFLNPNNLENFNYTYNNSNVAFFTENVFNLSNRLTVTPGLRFEYIDTKANGYYKSNIVATDTTKYKETRNLPRTFALLGLGLSYTPTSTTEIYANFSQNYRAITFNDMRVANVNARVDSNLRDVRGFNFDLGYRGTVSDFLNFDISVFWLSYKDRIGVMLQKDYVTLSVPRVTTNIGDSRNLGVEMFCEINFTKLFKADTNWGEVSVFNSLSLIDAKYTKSQYYAVLNRQVEYAPPVTNRCGLTYKLKNFSATWQTSYTAQQYSDATNAVFSGNALVGIIPEYWVMDFSVKFSHKWLVLAGGINNLTNNIYFTRRADSYPGPGIIPAEPRRFFITAGVKF